MHVADLGAGSGFFTRAAGRAVGAKGAVWAVDSDGGLLSRLKNMAEDEGLKNIEVVRGNIEVVGGTHLPEGAFDAVIAANTIFTVGNKQEFVAEIRRLLKKGGQATIVDWTASHGGLGPHEGHVVTRDQAQKVFESQNFSILRYLHTGAYHWGFVAKKK